MATQSVLVTGGLGYIGSHTCVALASQGYRVVILDNLDNSHRAVLGRLVRITSQSFQFIEGDVLDQALVASLLEEFSVTAVIHFAGLKAVGESVANPLKYYRCNVEGSLSVLRAMQTGKCRTFVFSSSATVYGEPPENPMRETFPFNPQNPYGDTKAAVEVALKRLIEADPEWNIAALRYFNPVGAHESGLIGEDPQGIPNNLMPYVAQVAVGRRDELAVFGDDYPTRDGTGIRDYIHVMDLAEGHVAALEYLTTEGGYLPVNLGTGQGGSVLEMITAFEQASGQTIPYRVAPRRPGDIAQYWSAASLAAETLGWRATRSVDDMCRDTWRWQSTNPQGFKEP